FGYLFNEAGRGPNDRHELGRLASIQDFISRGYIIEEANPVAVIVPGFATPRVYDFIVYDPVAKVGQGIEVKTTILGTITLDADQVAKDVVVMSSGGVVAGTGLVVSGVGYATWCWGCTFVDFRGSALQQALRMSGVQFYHGSFPGQYRP